MGKSVYVFGVLLAACGSESNTTADAPRPDAKPIDARPVPDAMTFPDAQPGAFACAGEPLPTTVPETIIITGSVVELSTGGTNPIAGTTVTAKSFVDDMVLGETTANGQGVYSLSLVTGGEPLDACFSAPHPNPGGNAWRAGVVFPPTALFDDTTVPLVLVKESTLGLLHTFTGVEQAPDTAVVVVVVGDCFQQQVAGAVVTNSANAPIRYTSNMFPSETATTTSEDGVAILLNVPPGNVTIDATVGGVTFRDRTVKVEAGTIVSVALVP